jgi:hypothetical protein
MAFNEVVGLRLVLGFVAGFLATLIFHQVTLALLWAIGLAPFAPYPLAATVPFGVPKVISLAFWGGVWGIVYALIDRRFPAGGHYWTVAFVFGAIAPTLIAVLVVAPLKGAPVAGGGSAALLVTALLVNGAWGIGTGVFLQAGQRAFGSRMSH